MRIDDSLTTIGQQDLFDWGLNIRRRRNLISSEPPPITMQQGWEHIRLTRRSRRRSKHGREKATAVARGWSRRRGKPVRNCALAREHSARKHLAEWNPGNTRG